MVCTEGSTLLVIFCTVIFCTELYGIQVFKWKNKEKTLGTMHNPEQLHSHKTQRPTYLQNQTHKCTLTEGRRIYGKTYKEKFKPKSEVCT